MKFTDTLNSAGLFVLRVAFGGFMLVHGWQKLSNFSDMSDKFPDPLGMGNTLSLAAAVGAEVGCSLLLVLGLGTRLAAIPLAFTMVIALFVIHADDPWQSKELAAVYLAGYVVITLTGPGRFALDTLVAKRFKSRSKSAK